jgi:MFS family permease
MRIGHVGGLLRHRDFRLLWLGDAVSQFGNQVSVLALPLIAVLYLKASVMEVGILVSAEFVGFFLFGLPAGAWCDRWRRRPVLIAADVTRFLLLSSVPLTAALGLLTIWQLLALALLQGVATVFFDVANQSYLPSLLSPGDLIEGNAKMQANESVAAVFGPSIAGGLIQALTAPFAVAVDAVSFLFSARCISLIRHREIVPEVNGDRHLAREIAEGLRVVLGNPLLRSITTATAVSSFFSATFAAVIMVFLARELALAPGVIGSLMSVGALGGLLGAVIAPRIMERLGHARSVWVSLSVGSPIGILIPLSGRGPLLICFIVGWFGLSFGIVTYNVAQVSLRQTICEPRLLGRMNATVRFLAWGAMPLGGLLGGWFGETLGIRPTLWVAQVGQLVAPAVLLLSPLSRMRGVPAVEVGGGRTGQEDGGQDDDFARLDLDPGAETVRPHGGVHSRHSSVHNRHSGDLEQPN